MLNDLLDAALQKSDTDFIIFIDGRYDRRSYLAKNIHFIEVSIPGRFSVDKKIKKLVKKTDLILNIGDLPPFIGHNCKVIQYLWNRYFFEKYTMKGLSFTAKLRLTFEKIAFSMFLKNADYLFVHNLVMKNLLLKKGYNENIIRVIPYKNIDPVIVKHIKKHKDSFIYVASEEAHKNHINLVSAWHILSKEGIYPVLYLTIDEDTELYDYIMNQVQIYNLNIYVLSKLSRDELFAYYQKVEALIYPSYFECFGIPMIEAQNFDLPIIAAELDYVWDLVDPVETFDPTSPRSISRAVKRFLGHPDSRAEVMPANQFIDELISYSKNA